MSCDKLPSAGRGNGNVGGVLVRYEVLYVLYVQSSAVLWYPGTVASWWTPPLVAIRNSNGVYPHALQKSEQREVPWFLGSLLLGPSGPVGKETGSRLEADWKQATRRLRGDYHQIVGCLAWLHGSPSSDRLDPPSHLSHHGSTLPSEFGQNEARNEARRRRREKSLQGYRICRLLDSGTSPPLLFRTRDWAPIRVLALGRLLKALKALELLEPAHRKA